MYAGCVNRRSNAAAFLDILLADIAAGLLCDSWQLHRISTLACYLPCPTSEERESGREALTRTEGARCQKNAELHALCINMACKRGMQTWHANVACK